MLHSLSSRRTALALAFCQLLLGVVLGAFHEIGGFVTEADFYGAYGPGARALAAGEPYVYTRSGPGLSALLAGLSWIGLDPFAGAKLVAALSVALLGLAAFQVASRLAGERCGLALQLLVYLVLMRYAFIAANDVPAAMLAWAALGLACVSERPRSRVCFAAGLLAGASFVTRYTGIALVAAIPVGLAFLADSWRRRAQLAGAFLGGCLLASAPWLIASQVWFGRPLHNQAHALIALDAFGPPGERYDQGELQRMEERFSSLGEVLLYDPPRLIAHFARDFLDDANQLLRDLVPFPSYLLLGLGVVLLASRAPPASRWLLAAVLALAALGFACAALVPYQSRYFFLVLPALLLPVAVACSQPWDTGTRSVRSLQRGAVLASLAVIAGGSVWKTHEYLTTEPTELIETSRVLARRAQPGERLMARKPQLGFLTRLTTLGLPDGPVEHLLAIARERGVRFLYVGPEEVRRNPELAGLARGDGAAGLEKLHAHSDPPGCLYALKP